MGERSEPERTCVGCRDKGSKADLLRLVRTPSGSVEVDPTGKAPGRGAYVHRSETCVRRAAGRLAGALRVTVGPETVSLIRASIERMGAPA